MPLSVNGDVHGVRVAAGEDLFLHINAIDPAGISRVFVQCFQFSLASSTKSKLATGELVMPAEQWATQTSFEIGVHLPDNAALGKWGVQLIEFTNARGYKTAFYRGQGKFDEIIFEVVAPTNKEEHPLRLIAVEIASQSRRA
jgi:hypothetical protein